MSDIFDSERRRRAARLGTEPGSGSDEDCMDPGTSARLRALEDWRLLMTGEADGNGRFGTLRKEFEADRRQRGKVFWFLATLAVSGLISGAAALVAWARDDGSSAREIEHLRAKTDAHDQEIRELRSRPAYRMPPTRQGDDP